MRLFIMAVAFLVPEVMKPHEVHEKTGSCVFVMMVNISKKINQKQLDRLAELAILSPGGSGLVKAPLLDRRIWIRPSPSVSFISQWPSTGEAICLSFP